MSWQGHWHGYGPWVGSGAEYAKEGVRRPGPLPNDPQTQAFMTARTPPMMTGHALLRRGQAAADRTWADVEHAVTWLQKCYAENPPLSREDGKTAYLELDGKTAYARDVLPRGVDVAWAYWMNSGSLASYSVVCCPSLHHPEIPCPLPPTS
ncbi:hypothetical protein ACH429_06120 [Streptomyces pathocidini]|uniref:Uncharacterized protein n=1 Tax=Streptomyces pathocidini TaxID=1650571 RepID=A0ABW7UQT7_9ACTN|nr:hypothetical protein [Streptomyces pathocidini]